MTTKLPLRRTILSATSATLLAGVAVADPAVTSKAAGDHAAWVLMQTATDASFDGQRLTLKKVSPRTLMFTERPQRIAEDVPTANVVQLWSADGTFNKQPPNAGVTAVVDGKLTSAVVELKDPKLADGSLSYGVRVIEGTLPASSSTVSVFIDQFCASCAGSSFARF